MGLRQVGFGVAVIGGLAISALLSGAAMAADGKKLFDEKGCVACHGEDAKTSAVEGYPRLAGQRPPYALAQMKDIKGGVRKSEALEAMLPFIEQVNDEEMNAIAEYVGSLPIGKDEGDPSADGKKLYMTKTCIACHGKDGNKPIQAYPRLIGQEPNYLLAQMKAIKTGERANGNSQAMKAVMHLVNDDEMKKITEYLSRTATQ
jgi:cytochrome c553